MSPRDSTAAILYRNKHDGTFDRRRGARAARRTARTATRRPAWASPSATTTATAASICSRRTSPTTCRRSIGTLARACSRTSASAAGLGVENRYVQWGVGHARSRQRRPAGPVLRDRQRLPGNRTRAAAVSRSAARGWCSATSARAGSRTSRSERRCRASAHSSRGAAFGDIDNDGDIDVLVMNMNEPPSLLRNDYARRHGWIELALEGTRSNRVGHRRQRHAHGWRAAAGSDACSASPATTRTTTSACTSGLARRSGPTDRGSVAGWRRARRLENVAGGRVVTIEEAGIALTPGD